MCVCVCVYACVRMFYDELTLNMAILHLSSSTYKSITLFPIFYVYLFLSLYIYIYIYIYI